jgi:hypothetical protein
MNIDYFINVNANSSSAIHFYYMLLCPGQIIYELAPLVDLTIELEMVSVATLSEFF